MESKLKILILFTENGCNKKRMFFKIEIYDKNTGCFYTAASLLITKHI